MNSMDRFDTDMGDFVLLENEDPMVGHLRSLGRLLIAEGRRSRVLNHTLTLMERECRFHMEDLGGAPETEQTIFIRVPTRWAFRLKIVMTPDLYEFKLRDQFGIDRRFVHEMMSFMPGFFQNIEALRKTRYSQNSTEAAVFYLLRFGQIVAAEFRGDREMCENDLTIAKMIYGPVLVTL
jgi:hypothetical protein